MPELAWIPPLYQLPVTCIGVGAVVVPAYFSLVLDFSHIRLDTCSCLHVHS